MKQEMVDNYIVKLENGAYRLKNTRISLDSVVYSYKRGDLPETIAQNFPFLTPAQVYGAIAFYLSNREEIDQYLLNNEIEFERKRQEQRAENPEFYAKWEKRREEFEKQKALTNK